MSYQVIARKYRPKNFREVVGQQHVTQTLANAIETNRVAHAYIFSGARGVGKTTTARILAKALNCAKGPTVEPCDECSSCTEIAAGTSLDVIEIDAASNRGIDQIRELREMVRYAPAASRNKVVILDEAHQLTDEASNALLKTLEEPPDRVIFVMATTQPEDLVDTIKSRSQHFHFRALSFQEISDTLTRVAKDEKLEIEPGALAVLARAAEGSVRDGLSLLEQAMAYCGRQIGDAQVRQLMGVVAEESLDELIAAIETRSAERALGLVHKLIAEGHNLQHFCREAIRHFRNLLLARVCGAESELIVAPADERPRLKKQAALFTEEDLTRFFQTLLATDDAMRHKPDPRLHLEIGLLKLVNAARLAPLEEVIAELRGEAPARPAASVPRATSAPAASTPRASSGIGFSSPGAAPALQAAAAGVRSESAAGVAPAPVAAPVKMESEAPKGAPVAMAPPSAVAQAVAVSGGLAVVQVDEIRAAVAAQNKLLGSLLEHVSRWELEGGEIRLFFPSQSRTMADIIQARDPMEKLRTITSAVLGQPLRVCVKLESSAAASAPAPTARVTPESRARFEQDPVVRAMLERFGGQISSVKRRDEG
ncbi:MAG: DNA polymerase III subunit gamma/tau [Acidobacteria bacterium]|nr:DNA polymerase III subunit gamma/tau [Acidobacteriota bacterium]